MIYDILFTASAETMTAIAADPKHLGARIGIEIAGLSGREREAGRIAQSINRCIDLGAQSAFAAADRFVFAGFFLAPALC